MPHPPHPNMGVGREEGLIGAIVLAGTPLRLPSYTPSSQEETTGKGLKKFSFFVSKSSLLKPTHEENGILGITAGAH